MKEKLKTIVALGLVGLAVLAGIVLDGLDKPKDTFPTENTAIRLYGEAHGFQEYYDIELQLWQERYGQGDRDLFVELPYYSAEFLNLWMQADDDELLDQFFEEIRGTLSGNEYSKAFYRAIKATCPETLFYGTDVGHQYKTTGARYLRYLEDHGLADSENYALAEACIRQGEAFASVRTESGVSSVREEFMIDNFVDAYARCGQGRIMGIYGSYHTDLDEPSVMGGQLKARYGDRISSVKLSTLATQPHPYRLGLCVTGIVFLLMLFVPNILWARREKPAGYEAAAKRENKVLLLLERAGEVAVTTALVIFPAFDPCIRRLPEGLFIASRIVLWATALVLMVLYECFWVRYFKSPGRTEDFYASYAGFPVAGATLPVLAVLILGIYGHNAVLTAAALILGVGHIGIHLGHRKALKA